MAEVERARDMGHRPGAWSALVSDPGPATSVLFEVRQWSQWDAQEQFEAQPEVVLLGDPWDLVPAAAVPFLEQFRQATAPDRAQRVTVSLKGLPAKPRVQDAAIAVDATHTVSQALRKAAPHLLG